MSDWPNAHSVPHPDEHVPDVAKEGRSVVDQAHESPQLNRVARGC